MRRWTLNGYMAFIKSTSLTRSYGLHGSSVHYLGANFAFTSLCRKPSSLHRTNTTEWRRVWLFSHCQIRSALNFSVSGTVFSWLYYRVVGRRELSHALRVSSVVSVRDCPAQLCPNYSRVWTTVPSALWSGLCEPRFLWSREGTEGDRGDAESASQESLYRDGAWPGFVVACDAIIFRLFRPIKRKAKVRC